MKTQGLQELVKKIFSDESAKAEFVSNPEKVLAQFSLNEDEKRALLKSQYRLALDTSGSQQFEAEVGPNSWWTAPVP